MCAGSADDVVLIDAVAADADRADELSVAIEREAAGKNGDAVRKSRIGAGRIENVVRKRRAPETRELLLQSVVRSRVLHIESGRIKRLRKESDGAGGDGEGIIRETNCGAAFLHRHIPTEERRLARPKRAEDSWLFCRIVRIIFHRNKNLHRDSDGQANPSARRARAIGGEVDDARHFRGGEARLAIDHSWKRIADNRLADFALHAAEGRDRIRERRRRALDRIAGRGVTGHNDGSDGRRGRQDVGQRDTVDVNVVGLDRAVGTKSELSGERDLFVFVVTGNKREGILRTENERPGHAVARHADATDEFSIFVKRNTTGRTIERSAEHGIDR